MVMKFGQCTASCWAHLRKQGSFLNPDIAADFIHILLRKFSLVYVHFRNIRLTD